eukprot:Phypoly_transcript_15652.p2 GENE.Phypoly_transcript_15652~~Phypoly_transcript_15652.p2  ORF type:complete len:215 (-),score=24.66 Phypoly_transcript_15652:36-680(-)
MGMLISRISVNLSCLSSSFSTSMIPNINPCIAPRTVVPKNINITCFLVEMIGSFSKSVLQHRSQRPIFMNSVNAKDRANASDNPTTAYMGDLACAPMWLIQLFCNKTQNTPDKITNIAKKIMNLRFEGSFTDWNDLYISAPPKNKKATAKITEKTGATLISIRELATTSATNTPNKAAMMPDKRHLPTLFAPESESIQGQGGHVQGQGQGQGQG